MPAVRIVTLGCKVNQYESQWVREGLFRLGYSSARPGESADLCVVNTCVVTGEAEAKSRKLIRRLHRENPRAEIVVIGCFAAHAAAEVARLPGVSEVIADKRELPDWLARLGLHLPPRGLTDFASRHRAFVKVQDGCRMKCSYCIIPHVRPYLESRPIEEVVDEIRGLVGRGHREIVLTGIHLGHYGLDDRLALSEGAAAAAAATKDRPSLVRLLHRLAELPGEFRVRLSSLEATEAGDDLLDLLRQWPNRFCPHLHLALQSGSNRVLRAMRRPWPVQRVLERCRAAKQALGDPALTTDVIVGFPGESDEDFAATCEAVIAAGFSKLHVFRFSPREGTEAALLPNAVEPHIKHQRAAELEAVGRRLRQEFCRQQVGKIVEVLVEGVDPESPGRVLGTSERYLDVSMSGGLGDVGCLRKASILGAVDETLYDCALSLPVDRS